MGSAEAAASTPTGPCRTSSSTGASIAGSALSGEEPSSTIRASGFGVIPKVRAGRPMRSASLVALSCSLTTEQRKSSADMRSPLSGVAIRPRERRGWRAISTVTLKPVRASKASAASVS